VADTTFRHVYPLLKAVDNGDGTYSLAIAMPDGGIAAAKVALADGKILVGNASNLAVAVTPSGDVLITNAGVTSIASGVIINDDVKSDAAIAFSKLAALPSAQLLVGNGSNVAAAVALSGDGTLSNAGELTLHTQIGARILDRLPSLVIHPNTSWSASTAVNGANQPSPTGYNQTVSSPYGANSWAKHRVPLAHSGFPASSYYGINIAKSYLVRFTVARTTALADFICHFNFGADDSYTPLATKGFGITLTNYELKGTGFNTELGETAALGTLTDNTSVVIWILHEPAVPKLSYWYNTSPFTGAATATITASANVPQTGSMDKCCQSCGSVTGGAGAVWGVGGPVTIWYLG